MFLIKEERRGGVRILISHDASVDFMLLNAKHVCLSETEYEWILSEIIVTAPVQLLNQPSFSSHHFSIHLKVIPSHTDNRLPQSSLPASCTNWGRPSTRSAFNHFLH